MGHGERESEKTPRDKGLWFELNLRSIKLLGVYNYFSLVFTSVQWGFSGVGYMSCLLGF